MRFFAVGRRLLQTDSVIVDTILLLKKEKLSWYTCFIIANPHILQVKFEGQIVLNHKQNLHTHTTYADGKDTLEELVREAIKRDFGGIGFSEYSYMEFSDYPYQMTVEQMAQIGLDVLDRGTPIIPIMLYEEHKTVEMAKRMMEKGVYIGKIIGIAPASFIGDPTKNRNSDFYRLGNNYTKRVVEAGCTPIGLAPAENWLTEEALEICDGFLIQGGAEFFPYHFQIIHHAVTRGKRYLGVCLGAQLIHAYFELKRRVEEQGYKN